MGVSTRTYLLVLAAAVAIVGASFLVSQRKAACTASDAVCCGPRHALHACASTEAGTYVLVKADATSRYPGTGHVCVVTNVRSELPNVFERLNVSGALLYRACIAQAEKLYARGAGIKMAVFGPVPDNGKPFVAAYGADGTELFRWSG